MGPQTCYLCGNAVAEADISDDHVIPKQLLNGKPPKRKGFDYGGVIATHERCNNEFGPETYAQTAFELIEVLHDPSAFLRIDHPQEPSKKLLVLNSAAFKKFGQRELKYFKVMDRRNHIEPVPLLVELDQASVTNPVGEATKVALSVLAKSAAALVISRKLRRVPDEWQILAAPYVGDTTELDFNELLGETVPFSEGIKIWLGRLETNDYFVTYTANRLLVFFLFRLSPTLAGWRHMKLQFRDATRFAFFGRCLNGLLTDGWRRV